MTPRSIRRFPNWIRPRRTRSPTKSTRMLWQEGFSLPLFQSPGDRAVRSDLANFGSPGLADVDWTAVGFMPGLVRCRADVQSPRLEPNLGAFASARRTRRQRRFGRDGNVDRLAQQAHWWARRESVQRRRPGGKPVEFTAAHRSRRWPGRRARRESSAPCASGRQLQQDPFGTSDAARSATARRGDQIAGPGDHHRRASRISASRRPGRTARPRKLVVSGMISRMRNGGIERKPIGFGGVVEFSERDAAHQVDFIAVRSRCG